MWNQETKDKWVKIMQAHQDADALMQGQWFNGEKGCFFGCAMQTDEEPLEKATKEMGLPIWLVYLAERIFEGLPADEALKFPVQLLEAAPVNVDFVEVECKQSIARLDRLLDLPDLPGDVISAINIVKERWVKRLDGVQNDNINWSSAESAAASLFEVW